MLSGDLRQNHVGVGTSIVGEVGTRLVGVVQGYRPQVDWGGDSGSATIVVGGHNVRVATSGWRRRCLYMLLLALLALSVINLSLTLWILKTVHFNMDGMGHLYVVRGGLQMDGATEFFQKMYVARIQSRKAEDVPIKGYYNLTIHTAAVDESLEDDQVDDATNATKGQGSPLGKFPAYMHINVEDILAGTKRFIVRDQSGTELFSADRHGTSVGANKFTVTGTGGAELSGSMQTPQIFSKGVHELRLDSVTRDIKVQSKNELRVEARNGDISSICTRNVALVAKEGAIRFDNPTIYIPKLHTEGEDAKKDGQDGQPTPTSSPTETQIPPPPPYGTRRYRQGGQTTPMPTPGGDDDVTAAQGEVKVFQVCVCPSGKLFVVEAPFSCVTDDVVCR